MKSSYKIITILFVVLAVSLAGLFVYQHNISNSSNSSISKVNDSNTEIDGTNEKDNSSEKIVPFTSMAEFKDVIYVTDDTAKNLQIEDAKVIPIKSICFAILDGDVYYITEGDGEYAPELRRCDLNGDDDVSVCEFVSPVGAPTLIGNSIYSAYYGSKQDDENTGIYKIHTNLDPGENYEKIVGGEYYIYGYDQDNIFYSKDISSSQELKLFKMSLNGENETEILNYPNRPGNIVLSGKYVYFSAFDDVKHCYKIYRSPKTGNGNIYSYSFECFSDKFDIIDNKLYYQADLSLFSCDLNGKNEARLCDIDENNEYAYHFLKFGNALYFREKTKETQQDVSDPFFKFDLETLEKSLLN